MVAKKLRSMFDFFIKTNVSDSIEQVLKVSEEKGAKEMELLSETVQKLHILRTRGIKQSEVASIAGIDKSLISQINRGKIKPSSSIVRIVDELYAGKMNTNGDKIVLESEIQKTDFNTDLIKAINELQDSITILTNAMVLETKKIIGE
jgi:predicted transcriptional regulator